MICFCNIIGWKLSINGPAQDSDSLTPFQVVPRQVAEDDNYSDPSLSFVGSDPLNQEKSSAYKPHLHTQKKETNATV